MYVAMALSWTIGTWAAAQTPLPARASDKQGKTCVEQFSPEIIAVDMRPDPAVATGKSAALPQLIAYFTCRALAENNPLICANLDFKTSSKNPVPRDQDCKSEYHMTSSILEVLAKKGDGVQACRQSLAFAIDADLDPESLCRTLPAGYFQSDARSLCARIPSGILGSRQDCELSLAYYDAEPKRCERRKNRRHDVETCKTKASLLKLLRSKDPASCRGVAMCAAALSRHPGLCAPYAQAAGQAFCAAYVKTIGAQGKGGKYTPQQSGTIKAAETRRWLEELRRKEREKKEAEE